jgi:heme-degrading monooxygenase HmoA
VHARVTTLDVDPSKIDEMVGNLRENDVPRFEEMDGFKGMTLLVDRDSGKCSATTFWESEDAMKATEEQVKDARRRAAETGGASQEPKVYRFEVALDTMV